MKRREIKTCRLYTLLGYVAEGQQLIGVSDGLSLNFELKVLLKRTCRAGYSKILRPRYYVVRTTFTRERKL